MKLAHLDLFSGIGGFSLAFEAEGFQTIGFSEIDPYASSLLSHHWPGVPNYGDVRNVPSVSCNIVTGGFPCQPFSTAGGPRRGKDDERYLWPEMLSIIQRCKPDWVLGENVAGLDGMGLDTCIDDLEASGYEVAPPFEIPACAVGSPQLRNRIWICAYSKCAGLRPRIQPELRTILCSGLGPVGFEDTAWSTWDCSPELPLLAYGISEKLDAPACKALGNAIVPQVARVFARIIRQTYV